MQQEAKHITAIDFSSEVLSIAKEKDIPSNKVTFLRGDAYNLESISGNFDACLANFWFSHISRARVQECLKQLHIKLGKGSRIFMADNVYLRALGGTLIKKENDEKTYKKRTLENGSKYEIIKNYYTETELRNIFRPYSNDLEVHIGQCFWWISYTSR
ncbi:Methyltransferase domain-containing protein [Gracilibacillus ureilyticus]|uniref:Methyltransferase domain-containing protein n=1 Tax=Gracilibacillus ureilyticus TaxID=531814 RepID=A0A1H9U5D2_9BACI|nr:Methyltransferase domain-containing protein [Gracilibacillus ureilyticus]